MSYDYSTNSGGHMPPPAYSPPPQGYQPLNSAGIDSMLKNHPDVSAQQSLGTDSTGSESVQVNLPTSGKKMNFPATPAKRRFGGFSVSMPNFGIKAKLNELGNKIKAAWEAFKNDTLKPIGKRIARFIRSCNIAASEFSNSVFKSAGIGATIGVLAGASNPLFLPYALTLGIGGGVALGTVFGIDNAIGALHHDWAREEFDEARDDELHHLRQEVLRLRQASDQGMGDRLDRTEEILEPQPFPTAPPIHIDNKPPVL